eukprot:6099091-Prorocentrum_lima.AAC.1
MDRMRPAIPTTPFLEDVPQLQVGPFTLPEVSAAVWKMRKGQPRGWMGRIRKQHAGMPTPEGITLTK